VKSVSGIAQGGRKAVPWGWNCPLRKPALEMVETMILDLLNEPCREIVTLPGGLP